MRLVGLAAFGLWAYGKRRRNGCPELLLPVISAETERELTKVPIQQVPTRLDEIKNLHTEVRFDGSEHPEAVFSLTRGFS